MKKKVIIMLLAIVSCLALAFGLFACSDKQTDDNQNLAKVESITGATVDQSNQKINMTVEKTTDKIILTSIVTVSSHCTWKIYNDNLEEIAKIVVPSAGENKYHIIVTDSVDENIFTFYDFTVYKIFEVSLNYYGVSGNIIKSETIDTASEYNITYVPEIAGYTFNHWKLNGEKIEKTTPYANVTVYADCTPIIYDIAYELNGGTLITDKNSYDIKTSVIFDTPDHRSDYEFLGWYDNENFNGEAITALSVGNYGNKTYYARWRYGTEGLQYSQNADGTYKISGYSGNDIDVTIPDTWEDKRVTSIGNGAFRDCNELTSITIPDSITSISDIAFLGCKRLVEVYNKSSLIITAGSWDNGYVAQYAKNVYTEAGGSKLTTDEKGFIIYDGNTLVNYIDSQTDIIIPTNITTINQYAFYKCKLTSITMPDSVTTIGEWAFNYCNSLTNITMPDSVTTIGDGAFCGCSGLTSITISNSVNTIGFSAFKGCSKLTSITIPENVTSIGSGAFWDCSELCTVNWNATNCIEAGSYNIPVFNDCSKLAIINIGDNVENIPSYAFSGCNLLISITIPNSVISIGSFAFSGCSRLEIVYYGGTAADWNNITIVSSGNDELTSAIRYYYSENEPTESGNYWHYDNDGNIVEW